MIVLEAISNSDDLILQLRVVESIEGIEGYDTLDLSGGKVILAGNSRIEIIPGAAEVKAAFGPDQTKIIMRGMGIGGGKIGGQAGFGGDTPIGGKIGVGGIGGGEEGPGGNIGSGGKIGIGGGIIPGGGGIGNGSFGSSGANGIDGQIGIGEGGESRQVGIIAPNIRNKNGPAAGS